MSSPGNRRKIFKSEASEILKNNYLSCILASIVAIVAFAGLIGLKNAYLYAAYSYLPADGYKIFSVVSEAVTVLLCVPVAYGYFEWMAKLYINKSAFPIYEMFGIFSSLKKIARSLVFFLEMLLKIIAYYIIPAAIFLLYLFYREVFFDFLGFGASDEVLAGISDTFVGLIFLCTFIFATVAVSKYSAAFYILISDENISVRKAFAMSKKYMRGKKGEYAALVISFLPLFILSFFTFAVAFAAYVMPYFAISLMAYANYIYITNDAKHKESFDAAVDYENAELKEN